MVSYMYGFNDKVKKHFEEMFAQRAEKLTISGALPIEQLELYMNGFTSQNYSYVLLLDLFEHENIKKVLTSHIRFGQSIDMSHDMALC